MFASLVLPISHFSYLQCDMSEQVQHCNTEMATNHSKSHIKCFYFGGVSHASSMAKTAGKGLRDFAVCAILPQCECDGKRFEARLDCRRKITRVPHHKIDLSISKHWQTIETKDGAVDLAELSFHAEDLSPAFWHRRTSNNRRYNVYRTQSNPNPKKRYQVDALIDLPITAWRFALTMSDLLSKVQSSSLPMYGATGVSSCQAARGPSTPCRNGW
jgi:hypothetical protein